MYTFNFIKKIVEKSFKLQGKPQGIIIFTLALCGIIGAIIGTSTFIFGHLIECTIPNIELYSQDYVKNFCWINKPKPFQIHHFKTESYNEKIDDKNSWKNAEIKTIENIFKPKPLDPNVFFKDHYKRSTDYNQNPYQTNHNVFVITGIFLALFAIPLLLFQYFDGNDFDRFEANLPLNLSENEARKYASEMALYLLKNPENSRYRTLRKFSLDFIFIATSLLFVIGFDLLTEKELTEFLSTNFENLFKDYRDRNDNLSQYFPFQFSCELSSSSYIQLENKSSVICVLPYNALLEKLYVLVWCVMLVMLPFCGLGFIRNFLCFFEFFQKFYLPNNTLIKYYWTDIRKKFTYVEFLDYYFTLMMMSKSVPRQMLIDIQEEIIYFIDKSD